MTREHTLKEYRILNNRIATPGRFQGCPIFAPHYWELAMEGMSSKEDGKGHFVFIFSTESFKNEDAEFRDDLQEWLGIRRNTLHLWQDDNGFIHVK